MGDRLLLAIAARVEWSAVCRGLLGEGAPVRWPGRVWEAVGLGACDAVLTGVGKGNAAAGIAMAFDAARHSGIVSVGIAGALPRAGGRMLSTGGVVVATDSVYADEGVRTPSGFESLAAMGFPPDDRLEGEAGGVEDGHGFAAASGELGDALARRLAGAGIAHERGVVATVSICSGTDALAADVAARTDAVVEAMEGAAGRMVAAHLSRRVGRAVAFGEVRIVSNNTGDYDKQVWRIREALGGVSGVVGALG